MIACIASDDPGVCDVFLLLVVAILAIGLIFSRLERK